MQLTDEMREYLKSEGLVCEVSKEYGHEFWFFNFMHPNDWVVCQADNYNNTGYDMSEVKITKGPTIAQFVCTNCGTEFEVPEYKCKTKMTGMNECHTVFKCPTCGHECWE